jgi:endonuclease/exonuclease/phosphatase family metal-dependent hydrolase
MLLAADSPIADNEGRPHVSWEDARDVIGRIAFVHGRVVDVTHKGRVNLMAVGTTEPGNFKIVIFQNSLGNFPERLERMYGGKIVQVRGFVSTYAGNPQIAVSSPEQISVLEQTPTTQPVAPPVRRAAGQELTIATYNILNLFDAEDDPYRNDDSTRPKPRAELNRVAQVIRKMDADILALQEVESRGYLERFIDVLLPDMGYEHVVHFEGNDVRGIDVCLLSRVPVGPVTSHRHLQFADGDGRMRRFNRDLLAVEFHPEGAKPFEIWVVHLKSNYSGRKHAEPIRVAEAQTIRGLLDRRLKSSPNADIMICGDFNDTPDSAALRTIIGTGPFALTSFINEIPETKRITYNREPYRSMIDFILTSQSMAKRYVPKSYRILAGSVETSGSDHNPVLAKFRLGGQ